jgi:hypothetical protein
VPGAVLDACGYALVNLTFCTGGRAEAYCVVMLEDNNCCRKGEKYYRYRGVMNVGGGRWK